MADNPLRTLDSFELIKLGKASVTVGSLTAGLLIVAAAIALNLQDAESTVVLGPGAGS